MKAKLSVVAKKVGSTKQIKDILVDQLFPDPHQPRMKIDPGALRELADSIDAEGLQQLPTVNFAFKKRGKDHFCIKEGERRWRAHVLLGRTSVECVVEEEVYDGTKRDLKRRLAQAAENGTHVQHTHSEIVTLVEESVEEEVRIRGGKHGAVEIGLRRVATAFGKSLAWASNYQTLTGLLPSLREMLDEDDVGERLNFGVGTALARAPTDVQEQLLRDAEPHFKKGGHAAGYGFIVRKAREIREARGEKIRGRSFDEKIRFMKVADRLKKLAEGFCEGRHSTEHKNWIAGQIERMSVTEVDGMLGDVNLGIQTFLELQKFLKEKRDANYLPLSIARRGRGR